MPDLSKNAARGKLADKLEDKALFAEFIAQSGANLGILWKSRI